MPRYIVKAEPDKDLYAIWSTVVDFPLMWGTRKQLTEMAPDQTENERFVRADEAGSSAFPYSPTYVPFGWNVEHFTVCSMFDMCKMVDNGRYLLARSNLSTFLDALTQDDEDTVKNLLYPMPEDDD